MTGADEHDEAGMDGLMAAIHIARQLSQAQGTERMQAPAAAELWAEVRRAGSAPVSLAVARALREDEAAAARYRKMLAAVAVAHSPVALAASDGEVTRRIGETVLRLLLATGDGAPLLLLEGHQAATALEMVGEDGQTLRLDLPQPDQDTVILALGPDLPETQVALDLLANPGTALYLLA